MEKGLVSVGAKPSCGCDPYNAPSLALASSADTWAGGGKGMCLWVLLDAPSAFFWGTGRRCTQLAPRQNVKPLSGATVDCGLWSSEFNCKG